MREMTWKSKRKPKKGRRFKNALELLGRFYDLRHKSISKSESLTGCRVLKVLRTNHLLAAHYFNNSVYVCASRCVHVCVHTCACIRVTNVYIVCVHQMSCMCVHVCIVCVYYVCIRVYVMLMLSVCVCILGGEVRESELLKYIVSESSFL